MRRSRSIPFVLAVVGLLALWGPVVGVAAQDPAAGSDVRGPQFLLAARRSSQAPVVVDAASVPVLQHRVSLDLRNASRVEALAEISRAASLRLVYADGVVPDGGRFALKAEGITVGAALYDVLLGTNVDVLIAAGGNVVLVKRGASRASAVGHVQGRVTDAETGRPLIAVDVLLERLGRRTTTDTAGRYRFADVDTGSYTLVARKLGYAQQKRTVVVRESVTDTVNIALQPKPVPLDSLVTTATGLQRRRDLGNDITTIRADSVMQHAPIKSLTDLLQNRVPGLTVRHTSGAPGDPARLRLRGLGSAYRSNDPIVFVDGMRVYAAQAEARNGNLANPNAAAPSPLDQIDPNIIEKIEIFKGASAATLYGADAANGVIVITTKRGKPGPTKWTAHISHSRENRAALYPTGYYRWGHALSPYASPSGLKKFCTLLDRFCVQDSLVQFQALNLPSLTPIGSEGLRSSISLSASGGVSGLTYSVTGSYSDETGYLRLPAYEVRRFDSLFGHEPPDWMQDPHHYKTWSVMSNVRTRLGGVDVGLMTILERTQQQRTDLENQLGPMARTYVDTLTGRYYQPSSLSTSADGTSTLDQTSTILSNYYGRTTASTLRFTTGLNAGWNPRTWFNADGLVSLDVMPRDDQFLVPAGLLLDSGLDSGQVTRGNGQSLLTTVRVHGAYTKRLPAGFRFVTDIGADIQTTNIGDVRTDALKLLPGTTSISGARVITATDSRVRTSVFGWHIEPTIRGDRFSLSTGLRLDGGSAYGTRISGFGSGSGGNRGFLRGLLALPKLNGSWVISEEPWFPFQSLFSSLRLRGAYGQAQVQPGPTDRLRIYDGSTEPTTTGSLSPNIGNTQLRPERSTDFEGGVDADLFDNRISLILTGYRRLRVDALMPMALPGSVNGGGSVWTNVGNILNRGIELTLTTVPLRLPSLTWSTELQYSRNSNKLVKLGRGVLPNPAAGLVEGYPVESRWDRPILGFADQNGDGILQREEVQVGDSLVYLGRLLPAYTMSLHTNLALFNSAIEVTGTFSYENGAMQKDELARDNWVLTRALVDPNAPLSEQAAVVAYRDLEQNQVPISAGTSYGLYQAFSAFRFEFISINYNAPVRVARLFRAQSLAVALQGRNLGLHTTYRGRDPDVTAWGPGEQIRDSGQIPQPREWGLTLLLGY